MKASLVSLDYVRPSFWRVKVFFPFSHPQIRTDEALETVYVRGIGDLGEQWGRL
jgi:hypothetical protein